jgi:hypothetical protein
MAGRRRGALHAPAALPKPPGMLPSPSGRRVGDEGARPLRTRRRELPPTQTTAPHRHSARSEAKSLQSIATFQTYPTIPFEKRA